MYNWSKTISNNEAKLIYGRSVVSLKINILSVSCQFRRLRRHFKHFNSRFKLLNNVIAYFNYSIFFQYNHSKKKAVHTDFCDFWDRKVSKIQIDLYI